VFPGALRRLEWRFADPAAVAGPDWLDSALFAGAHFRRPLQPCRHVCGCVARGCRMERCACTDCGAGTRRLRRDGRRARHVRRTAVLDVAGEADVLILATRTNPTSSVDSVLFVNAVRLESRRTATLAPATWSSIPTVGSEWSFAAFRTPSTWRLQRFAKVPCLTGSPPTSKQVAIRLRCQ
jgi:hypothetical protein